MKVGVVPFLTFEKKLGKRTIMIHDIIFCEVVFGIPYNRGNNSDVVLNSQSNFLKLYSSFTK